VVRLSEDGQPIETLWDPSGAAHSTITSMREHQGYLYLGGLENNRIGRVKLKRGNPNWVSWESYWGGMRQ
jgi:ribose transport system permease protein